jgi:predicted transcriptional regulator
MSKVSLTTRIDSSVNDALEEIARFEKREPSELADLAIRNLVEERQAMRDLVSLGIQLVDGKAAGIEPEAVHDWLDAEDDRPFPSGR